MKIIAFNSYKGGACRTTTCYNTLPYLAEKLGATEKEPILLFDVDLDSYGMTSLLLDGSTNDAREDYTSRNLFVDDDAEINKKIKGGRLNTPWYKEYYNKYFVKVGNKFGLEQDGAILFCGVNPQDDTISDEEFKLFKNNLPLDTLISELDGMEEGKPKAVVFDCAAGIQQTTRCILTVMTHSVMCMRPTSQFRMGTRDYLISKFPAILADSSTDYPDVILLPTAVAPITPAAHESDGSYELLKQLKKKAFTQIENEIVENYDEIKSTKFVGYELRCDMFDMNDLDEVGIPEIERFKWEESKLLCQLENLGKQELSLERQYKKLAEILARG